jgi:hypothetical protein
MRRKGQGSASISAVVVFLSALLAIGLMATILPPVANVLSGFREGLRERGERGSELIRIYIHTANETELEPPIITIINGYDRESILTDYVVVARDGRVLAAGKMGGSLGGIRIPAGARIDMTPADFGLSYGTFAAMADEVKAIYVRTAEGNSFGSSYGPPPKINPDYQLSITQRSQHIIVIGSTVTSYNFTILGNLTLPTTGDAMVVKNVILVDRNGFVRGGVTAGSKWSDGSFDPNKIPDSVAALTRTTDVVPIGGYYAVPPFPMDHFNCDYSNPPGIFSVYSGCDTSPRYIEMVEFYPVEYYTPGSPVTAAAYWFRYGGLPEVVYRSDLGRTVTVTRQVPATLQYPATVTGNVIQVITVQYGGTLAQILTNTATLADSGNLLILTPWMDYYLFDEEKCYGTPNSWYTSSSCSKSFYIPADQSYRIAEVDYSLSISCRPVSGTWSYAEGSITLNGPWGTYTSSGSGSLFGFWSTGTQISFQASGSCRYYYICCPGGFTSAPDSLVATVRVVLMKTSAATATRTGTIPFAVSTVRNTATVTLAGNIMTTQTGTRTITTNYYSCVTRTLWGGGTYCQYVTYTTTYTITYTTSYLTGTTINLKDQVKSAIVNGTQTLSGDAVAHLAGTVQGGQIIKVKAPIVLLNYIYGIAGSPPAPPSGGGGGGGEIGAKTVCTVDQSVQSINPPPSDTSSSGSSTNQPLESISGGTVSGFSVQQNTVQVLRNVVCRPVTLPPPA